MPVSTVVSLPAFLHILGLKFSVPFSAELFRLGLPFSLLDFRFLGFFLFTTGATIRLSNQNMMGCN
jgi:hypothetical protein